jgi:hypothetical protein
MDRSERAVFVSCLVDEDLSSVLFNVEAFLLRDRYHSEGEGEGEEREVRGGYRDRGQWCLGGTEKKEGEEGKERMWDKQSIVAKGPCRHMYDD